MAKTPEQWLEEAAPEKKGGTLKLFLGYAPGVGKTYSMLSEAIRRKSRGEDVVIGMVETHGRKGVVELVEKLEIVPRKKLEYKGTVFEEMDLDGILARKPAVVLVDELAHTNIEGSRHHKRYEDVLELLDNDICVLTTMNVQHLESVAPSVQRISGVTVRETVPDWVMKRVREVVMADLTPEALQTRMRRGDIYPLDRARKRSRKFFSSRDPDRSPRAGFAGSGPGGGPQPRNLSRPAGRRTQPGDSGKICGRDQLQSRGAAAHCPGGSNGTSGWTASCTSFMWTSASTTTKPISGRSRPTFALPKRWALRWSN